MSVYPYAKPKTKKKGKYGPGWQNPYATAWAQGGGQQQPQQAQGGPDYAGLINNMLNQTRADNRAESMADASQRDAAMRRLMISWGAAPTSGLSGQTSSIMNSLLDPQTLELINQNMAGGTAIKARIDKANEEQLAAIPEQQAGRGMLHSGETGAAQAKQAQAHTITSFDALNEMIGGLEGAVGSFASNERARQRAEAQAEQDAAWRSAELWGAQNMGGYGMQEEPAGPQAGLPYGGIEDPYWQELINWYSATPNMGYGTKKKRVTRGGGGGGGGFRTQ